MKKNYNAIDLVKFISAFLVIGVHTYPFLGINDNLNYFYVQVLGRVAVPFFFVASSFLFFKKINFEISLKEDSNLILLKNYLFRIFKLYIVWCLIYLVFIIIPGWIKNGFEVTSIVRLLRDFIFTGGYYHLWFLPAMIISTSIIYYLLTKFEINKIFIITFILYIIGMLINVYGKILLDIPVLSNIVSVYLAIFSTSRNGIFFGPIFTLIGLIISNDSIKINQNNLLLRVIISFILFVAEALIINYFKINNDKTCMYLMLVPFSLYFFIMIININLKNRLIYRVIRHLSTLLYVSHLLFVFIISLLPSNLFNNFALYLLVCCLSLLFSYLVYSLSDHIKIFKELY